MSLELPNSTETIMDQDKDALIAELQAKLAQAEARADRAYNTTESGGAARDRVPGERSAGQCVTARAFDPTNPNSTVWGAMFAPAERSASVDSPEFRELIRLIFGDVAEVARRALIAHINTWSDERCNTAINQLAASGAVVPSLTDEQRESIAGAVARGWCAPENANKVMDPDLAFAIAAEVEKVLSLATPVAGWVSVEERLPNPDSGIVLVASSWGVRPAYRHDPQWANGCFQDAITNCDEGDIDGEGHNAGIFKVTHWQELPPAPVATPT